ncbi:UPF0193 protein EVG1 [Hippocampus comes]|uniref:UPF0193 protein EVG1 n=1 Tax=Hippocampus comes TaxID=109280 RepID=UPI00094E9F3B|nr:PREDICTED: UPF0193 protein EVG1 [Hippocampus comes]XP_019744694.1 PREDICTED: UPF0193 protein EVG1 [Hippocampus comes]XP_019744695.1 PREDICTED: UPF0193 protein EVG1 [Hippocampus comes]XP_019744696.1 PREDICTED: UPF0193 protein EVG1 [Hippocampus comes]
MEMSSHSRVRGGLRKHPRAIQYSKETRDLLTSMMQEFTLSNLQRKQISDCLKDGSALPPITESLSSLSSLQLKASQNCQKLLPVRPLRRSAVSCRSANNYVREKFCPAPTRDLEKEKKRLQNILATGQEEEYTASQNVAGNRKPEVTEETDRYQEVLDEIQERRQFLADMASLGQERQYIHIMNTEISQKIRELELLNGKHPNQEAVSELNVEQRL